MSEAECSEKGLNDIIEALEEEVEFVNVFKSCAGRLARTGVLPIPEFLSIRGLLYIQVGPTAKEMRVVNLVYDQFDLQVPLLFNHIQYELDDGNNVSGSWQTDLFMDKAFPFPVTAREIPNVEQVLDTFVDESITTSNFEDEPYLDMFSTDKELVLMFYKLVVGDTNEPIRYQKKRWRVNIHRFPGKNNILLWYE